MSAFRSFQDLWLTESLRNPIPKSFVLKSLEMGEEGTGNGEYCSVQSEPPRPTCLGLQHWHFAPSLCWTLPEGHYDGKRSFACPWARSLLRAWCLSDTQVDAYRDYYNYTDTVETVRATVFLCLSCTSWSTVRNALLILHKRIILYIWKQLTHWLSDTPLANTEALRSGYGGGYNQFSRWTLILSLFLDCRQGCVKGFSSATHSTSLAAEANKVS